MRRRALLVGVQRFDDRALATLRKPEADILSLSRILRDTAIAGFEVTELIDPTAGALRAAVFDLFEGSKRDDLLLFYYAGHGILDDYGSLYLTARDTEKRRFRASGLDSHFVVREMSYARARRQLIVLDCCHSGAFGPGARGSLPSLGTLLQAGGGRVVITSCDATQYAWEEDKTIGDSPTSPFATLLIDGIRSGGADTDGNGAITVTELFDHIQRGLDGARQRPNIWISEGVGDFVVAGTPAGGAPAGTRGAGPHVIAGDLSTRFLIGLQRLQNELLWLGRRYRALLAGATIMILASGGAYAGRDLLHEWIFGTTVALTEAEEREAKDLATKVSAMFGEGQEQQIYEDHFSSRMKGSYSLGQAEEVGRTFRDSLGFGRVAGSSSVRVIGAQALGRLPTGERGKFYALSLKVDTTQGPFFGYLVLGREIDAWKLEVFNFMPQAAAASGGRSVSVVGKP